MVLSVPAPLWAEGTGPSDKQAKDYNRKAITAFKAGQLEEALENFERAFELLPDAKVRLNLGVANEQLRRLDEARGHYEAFLRENPKSDKAPAVRQKLAAVENKMKAWGKVIIRFDPTPEEVDLLGMRFTTFPMKVWGAPGTYPLLARKEGYERLVKDVEFISGDRTEVSLALTALPKPPAPPVPPAETVKEPPPKDPVAGPDIRDVPPTTPAPAVAPPAGTPTAPDTTVAVAPATGTAPGPSTAGTQGAANAPGTGSAGNGQRSAVKPGGHEGGRSGISVVTHALRGGSLLALGAAAVFGLFALVGLASSVGMYVSWTFLVIPMTIPGTLLPLRPRQQGANSVVLGGGLAFGVGLLGVFVTGVLGLGLLAVSALT
jgi:hypothetical protein